MWPNPQETTDLVTFTYEILNGKLHFLCSVLPSGAWCLISNTCMSLLVSTKSITDFLSVLGGYLLVPAVTDENKNCG